MLSPKSQSSKVQSANVIFVKLKSPTKSQDSNLKFLILNLDDFSAAYLAEGAECWAPEEEVARRVVLLSRRSFGYWFS